MPLMRQLAVMLLTVHISTAQALYINALSGPAYEVERAMVSDAVNTMAKGDLANASRKFEQILEGNPNSWAALLGLADLAHLRKDGNQVEDYLSRAYKAAPDNAAVQTAWGRFKYLNKDYEGAETAFLTAIKLDPNLADPHGELGALYFARLKKPAEAIRNYEEAVRLAPTVPDYQYALSSALSVQNREEDALEVLSSTQKLLPEEPYPLQLRANILAAHGRVDEALEALAMAEKLAPELPQIYFAEGELHLRQNNLASARQAYKKMARAAPGSGIALERLGLTHQLGGDFPEAEKLYLAALQLDPNLPVALNNLAYGALQDSGRHREALAWARRAVALAPENPQFLDTLGMAQHANAQLEAAITTLEKALELADVYPPANYHLGLIFEEQGRIDKAKQHYELAASGIGEAAALSRARMQALTETN